MTELFIKKIIWCIFILSMIAGIWGIRNDAIATGILFLLFGLSIFPPLFHLLKKKYKKAAKSVRVLIGILLLSGAVITLPKSNPLMDYLHMKQEVTKPDTSSGTSEAGRDTYGTIAPSKIPDNQADAATNKKTESKGTLSVHFINVGQGDAILIRCNNHFMLIDAGENEEGDTVAGYLKKQGVKTLDYVIGTHPHSDHVGGLDTVIQTLDIKKVIVPNVSNSTRTFEEVIDAVAGKGLKLTKPVVGEEYKLSDASFIILAPNSNEYADLNNNSIVIKLTFGENSFLLTGDAEKLSEKEMLDSKLDLSADVLKLGHHGSDSSTSEEFLDAVNPKAAVISVGVDNKYGHPMAETLKKVLDRGIAIYRTDELGTIIVTSDGKNITFHQEKDIIKQNADKSKLGASIGTAPPESDSNDRKEKTVTVYITDSGTKYHRDGCSFLRESKIPIRLYNAEKQGYEPCTKCRPPQ